MAKIGVFDLSMRYGKLTALSDMSFTMPEGERLFISGPNGALHNIAGVCNRERNVFGLT